MYALAARVAAWLEGWGLHADRVAIGAFGIALAIVLLVAQDLLLSSLLALLYLAPIVGPPLTIYGAFHWWVNYARLRFLLQNEMVLLEVVMPQTVRRSPRAMQAFFEALYMPSGETTFLDVYWKGKMRPFWALEIVANNGQVRFYFYTRKALRSRLEAMLYGYYPEIEVREVEDYTRRFPYREEEEELIGFNFKLAKPDVYPIRTFADFRADDPFLKPEERVDPLGVVLEQLADIGPDEHAWLQIVFRAHKPKERDLRAQFKSELAALAKEYDALDDKGKPDYGKLPAPVQDLVKAMQRKLEQHHYQVGMRFIYKAKKGAFQGPKIPGFVNLLQVFNSQLYNSFAPWGWLAEYNYPWQDPTGYRQASDKRRVFYLYQRRAWFTPYYWDEYFVLSSEELATLFHPVGVEILGPRMPRLEARRVEPSYRLPSGSASVWEEQV